MRNAKPSVALQSWAMIERGKGWEHTSRAFWLTLGRCATRHGVREMGS